MSKAHEYGALFGALLLAVLATAAFLMYRSTPVVLSPTSSPETEASTTPELSGQIDEHLFVDNTPIEVNFCGNEYLVKQIIIEGVDVVQRIAYLATNRLFTEYGQDNDDYGLCAYIGQNFVVRSEIQASLIEILRSKTDSKIYDVGIVNHSFKIDVTNGGIYYGNGVNSLVGPIGYLK
ncbi:MAG TPA: hypothetical protein VI953_03540 [Candidatus Paceibacterota bacterium]